MRYLIPPNKNLNDPELFQHESPLLSCFFQNHRGVNHPQPSGLRFNNTGKEAPYPLTGTSQHTRSDVGVYAR